MLPFLRDSALDSSLIFGAVIDEALGEAIRVTVIATGFGGSRRRRRDVRGLAGERQPARREGFDVKPDLLDVPSFLREP